MKEKWKGGRQDTGYFTRIHAQGKNWDFLTIKYPVGSYIVPHRDGIPGYRHYRLNILLWGEQTFRALGPEPVIFQFGPFVFFRPDLTEHEVLPSKRLRLVLSFGFRLR